MAVAQKKAELIGFIQWKLKHDPEYLKQVLPQLKKMSWADLQAWAIRNDIID
jgi:hypothetical protein